MHRNLLPTIRRPNGAPAGMVSHGTSGSVAVEFALSLPVLALMFFGLADFGSIAVAKNQVGASVSAGASFATGNGFDASKITTAVLGSGPPGMRAIPAPFQFCGCPNSATGVQPAAGSPPNCSGTCPGGRPAGTYATISAQLPFRTLIPWPGMQQTVTLNSSTTVRLR